ncbi:uncharacterized protein LOC142503529 isoform X2 [Ascaphus truei]|uniref:uncharacterized protein LOC142503529 isoform X2 n=1 Tax=Ascaphus truei TaxID=8439 RepID=UPI003F5AAE9B
MKMTSKIVEDKHDIMYKPRRVFMGKNPCVVTKNRDVSDVTVVIGAHCRTHEQCRHARACAQNNCLISAFSVHVQRPPALRQETLPSPTPLRKHRSRLFAKALIRPFSALGPEIMEEVKQKENVPSTEGNANKATKSKCKSASGRLDRAARLTWKTEVECIPNLNTLCQQQCKLPLMSALELRDIAHWSSSISPSTPIEDSTASDLPTIYDATGKSDTQQLQNETKYGNVRCIKPGYQSTRHVVLKGGLCHQAEQKNVSKSKMIKSPVVQKEMVSLSIEDEMKKPQVKIITIRPQEITCVQNVSETHPVLYYSGQKHNILNTWPGLQRDFITNKNYLPSFPNQTGNPWTLRASSALQRNLDYAKSFLNNKQTASHKAAPTRNKKTTRLLSANEKIINIYFLSADGTKQMVELTKDSTAPTQRNLDPERPGKIPTQEGKPESKSISISQMKQGDVGPVITGVNPRNEINEETSLYTSNPFSASKSLYLSGTRAKTYSQVQRPNSVGEMRKWNYILISKPLTPLGCHLSSSPRNSADPVTEVSKDTGRPAVHFNMTGPLTTRPVLCESQEGRRCAFMPAEANSQQTDLGAQNITETQLHGKEIRQENECCEGEHLSSVRETPHMSPIAKDSQEGPKSPSIVTGEEVAIQLLSSVPTYSKVLPVISIPTAQTDVSE